MTWSWIATELFVPCNKDLPAGVADSREKLHQKFWLLITSQVHRNDANWKKKRIVPHRPSRHFIITKIAIASSYLYTVSLRIQHDHVSKPPTSGVSRLLPGRIRMNLTNPVKHKKPTEFVTSRRFDRFPCFLHCFFVSRLFEKRKNMEKSVLLNKNGWNWLKFHILSFSGL